MVENKRIVMVGIPGVGKTTLLFKIVEIIKKHGKSVHVVSFGTLMCDVAKKNGLHDRDELRKLPITEQQNLQKITAEKIAALTEQVIIIDTHVFINSPGGYYPGLPENVLKIIKPTNFVSISAKPEEIYNRRMKDDTRNRDKITVTNIKKELDIQAGMISACSVITGSPVKFINNREGKIDETAEKIINAVGV
ncbi:MAG: adenylate kinase [Candidatus Nitrosopumilus sp. MTA1]|uniref:Adenylate kinase n=1 Tax=Marine Group I thaumarchaeote TaxID=2511932 RepID=A0A7K4MWM1_9ARCH|nr:MAG: adenylate kinase [Nitrosopumilus sp. YT1]NMI82072.1 adenylate kinase [Candidatus Nitrosopumilus sp. MTA1]NWJ57201.1 adenylate kinase [Marine Group I thaumarchaeote]NWK01117.1 adenylate kinase [Marine Group I thaumarchaeote]